LRWARLSYRGHALELREQRRPASEIANSRWEHNEKCGLIQRCRPTEPTDSGVQRQEARGLRGATFAASAKGVPECRVHTGHCSESREYMPARSVHVPVQPMFCIDSVTLCQERSRCSLAVASIIPAAYCLFRSSAVPRGHISVLKYLEWML
jgi:hypothetical protein